MPQLAKDAAGDFVVASYLFIPWARPDGTMQPLVGQGWSLNYEMMFYLIFSMALFAPRRIAVLIASLVILGIAAAGYLFEFESSILKFWTSRIIVEFVFGMLIAAIFVEGVRLPRWIGWTLLSLGFGLFIASPQLHDWLNGRLLRWGIPAAIMALAVGMGNLSWRGFSWRWLLLIGDASYSLYLSHAIVIRGMFAALRRLELTLPFWPGLLVSLALCAAVAILLFYAVERPLTRVLRLALVVKPPAQRPTESLAR